MPSYVGCPDSAQRIELLLILSYLCRGPDRCLPALCSQICRHTFRWSPRYSGLVHFSTSPPCGCFTRFNLDVLTGFFFFFFFFFCSLEDERKSSRRMSCQGFPWAIEGLWPSSIFGEDSGLDYYLGKVPEGTPYLNILHVCPCWMTGGA